MPTFKLTLAYDGTKFSGWQAQPGRRTVQGVLQEAWLAITGEQVRAVGSSRTDAGVHALGQVVGVQSETLLPARRLLGGVNAKLPEDVVLLAVELVPDGFHATHDTVGKRYRYQLHNSRLRPLLDRQQVWHVHQTLDVDAMHRAGQLLVGKHDFASFQSTGSPRISTVRTITAVQVMRARDPSQIWIEVASNGFLYNMVRNLVGTLIEVGVGRRPEAWIGEVLAACDRQQAGQTAPPQGLLLLEVDYGAAC
jgi:tRNA pseudouridine38-40 synthase